MNAMEIVAGVLLIIASIFIIVVIMLQESKQQGVGVVTGDTSNNFMERNGGRTKDAFLAKLTKIVAVIFFVITIGMNLIVHFM